MCTLYHEEKKIHKGISPINGIFYFRPAYLHEPNASNASPSFVRNVPINVLFQRPSLFGSHLKLPPHMQTITGQIRLFIPVGLPFEDSQDILDTLYTNIFLVRTSQL